LTEFLLTHIPYSSRSSQTAWPGQLCYHWQWSWPGLWIGPPSRAGSTANASMFRYKLYAICYFSTRLYIGLNNRSHNATDSGKTTFLRRKEYESVEFITTQNGLICAAQKCLWSGGTLGNNNACFYGLISQL